MRTTVLQSAWSGVSEPKVLVVSTNAASTEVNTLTPTSVTATIDFSKRNAIPGRGRDFGTQHNAKSGGVTSATGGTVAGGCKISLATFGTAGGASGTRKRHLAVQNEVKEHSAKPVIDAAQLVVLKVNDTLGRDYSGVLLDAPASSRTNLGTP